jgi:NTE family protein
MSINISGNTKRIGLALSGGGFRAAAFHLGVFRKLAGLRLLDKLDVLSCVSGGSIAGATLAAGWTNLPATLDRLETYLKTRSIAISSIIGGLLDPFETRTDKLAESYDRDLFAGKTLEALRAGPRLYLNATNLATGNLFSFVTGGSLDTEMGDYELGRFEPAKQIAISRAVAASSSFPPVFPPLRLSAEEFPPRPTVEYVTLTDGGVYDNLGINPLIGDRNHVDYMIVSDAGSPFTVDGTPVQGGLTVLTCLVQIMMEQIRGLEFDRMKYRAKAGVGPKPLWFSIDSVEGEAQPGDASLASGVGTNLKRLSDAELSVLARHGASLAEARLRKFAPELVSSVL